MIVAWNIVGLASVHEQAHRKLHWPPLAFSAKREKELCLLLPSPQVETGCVVFRAAQPSTQVNSASGKVRVPVQDRACFKEILVMEANSIQMTPTAGSFKIMNYFLFCSDQTSVFFTFYFLNTAGNVSHWLNWLIDWRNWNGLLLFWLEGME